MNCLSVLVNYGKIQYIEKVRIGKEKMLHRQSSIELITASILDDLKIEYHKIYIFKYEIDFFLPKYNLAIEVQGDYFHNRPRTIRSDKAKATYLRRYYPQYKLRYLWEHEFLAKDRIINQIRYWCGLDNPSRVNFNLNKIIFTKINCKEAEIFISKYHHAGRVTDSNHVYGATINGILIGVGLFCKLIKSESTYKLHLAPSEILELRRFATHSLYNKPNCASYILSRMIKMIDDDQVQCLVAFSDHTFNHYGTIHKATNWQYDGEIEPSYWYVDTAGHIILGKTLRKYAKQMLMTEHDFAVKYNYTIIKDKGRSRYIYWRNRCQLLPTPSYSKH